MDSKFGELFVSLHIPKTGGTSLHNVLSQRFGNGFNTAYGKLAAKSAIIKNDNHTISCIHGHSIMNEYEHLIASVKNQQWITFLRDPLEGAISLYYFTRKSLNKNPSKPLFEDRGLDAWLLNTEKARWPFPHGYPNNRYSSAIRRTTKSIEQFDFVGVTERFDESMRCMFSLFGWDNLSYKTRNKGLYTTPHIDPEIVARFKVNNSKDYTLYNLATKNLDTALSKYGNPD